MSAADKPGAGPARGSSGGSAIRNVGVDAQSATATYRARFDECGPDGAVRASTVLRWAQDVAWIHSEGLGFGRDWYAGRGLAWLVRAVDLTIIAAPGTGTELAVTTRVVGWRRVMARRRTDFVDRADRLAAWALTDWAMTDESGAPTRVPAEFPARFVVPGGPFTPVRLPATTPPATASVRRSAVRAHEIDPMGHVNNAVYLDYMADAIAADRADRPATGETWPSPPRTAPRRYRLEYLLGAGPSDELVARTWPEGDDICFLLARQPSRTLTPSDDGPRDGRPPGPAEDTIARGRVGPGVREPA